MLTSMFNLSDGFKQQMSAILIADDILKDMKTAKREHLKSIDGSFEMNNKYMEVNK